MMFPRIKSATWKFSATFWIRREGKHGEDGQRERGRRSSCRGRGGVQLASAAVRIFARFVRLRLWKDLSTDRENLCSQTPTTRLELESDPWSLFAPITLGVDSSGVPGHAARFNIHSLCCASLLLRSGSELLYHHDLTLRSVGFLDQNRGQAITRCTRSRLAPRIS